MLWMCCCARAAEGNRKWASHCDQLTESVGEALWSGSFLTTHALSAIHRLTETFPDILPADLCPLSLRTDLSEWFIRVDSESFVIEFCTVWVFNVDLNLIELQQNKTKTTRVSIAELFLIIHSVQMFSFRFTEICSRQNKILHAQWISSESESLSN